MCVYIYIYLFIYLDAPVPEHGVDVATYESIY